MKSVTDKTLLQLTSVKMT